MLTFDDVLQMLQSGKSVELKFYLSMGLFSRHELSLVDGKIEDFSYVDETIFTSTIEEYRNSFHGKAFISNAVEIEEIYER
ncbi:MAG: hypothetical protein Q8L88_00515 [Bacteroidota bacterium]|nr:hypothetical protein [Bacteroidota bacterium]